VTTSVRLHPIEHLFSSGVFWLAVSLARHTGRRRAELRARSIEAVQHGNIRLQQRLEQWLQPVLVTIDMHHSIEFSRA
jgi:hypothetical protein